MFVPVYTDAACESATKSPVYFKARKCCFASRDWL